MKNEAAAALGSIRTAKKSASSAVNGAKGGRPATPANAPGRRVTYLPEGVNNFHNSPAITLVVSGRLGWAGGMYIINSAQARRIEKHFCSVTDCRCPHGAAEQLDESGSEWGIRLSWCQ